MSTKIIYCFLFLSISLNLYSLQQENINVLPGNAEEGIFTFIYPGAFNSEINGIVYNRKIFVPLNQIFELLQIKSVFDFENLIISGYYINIDSAYEINFNSNSARIVKREYALNDSNYIIGMTDVFISPGLLKELFSLELEIKFSKLLITLNSKEDLPVLLEIKRKKQYSFLTQKDDLNKYNPLMFDRKRSWINGALLQYSIRGSYSNYERSFSGSGNLGMELLGGDLQENVRANYSASSHYISTDYNTRWRYYFSDNPFLTQFIAGDQYSSSYRMTYLPNYNFKGIQITNEKTSAPISYDNYIIRDKIEPGWQVELYKDGQLYKQTISDGAGYYEFEMPINYGTSNFELKFYGPKGGYFSKKEVIQIPFEFLRPGEFKYTLNTGFYSKYNSDISYFDNNSLLSGFRATVGITRWLTNSFDYSYRNDVKKHFYRNEMSLRIKNDMSITFDYFHNELSKIIFNYWPLDFGSYKIIQTWNTKPNEFISESLVNSTEIYVTFPRIINGMSMSVRERFDNNKKNINSNLNSNIMYYSIPYNFSINYNMFYTSYKDSTYTLQSHFINASAGLYFIPLNFNKFWGASNISLNSYFDITSKKIVTLGLNYSQLFFRDFNLIINPLYNFILKMPILTVSLRMDLNSVRSTTAFAIQSSNYSLSEQLDGMLGFDSGAWGFIVANPSYSSSYGNSAVAVRVFLDENQNDKYDRDEYLFPNVGVFIEKASMDFKSSSDTKYAYSLIPYSRYNIKINPGSIKNPNMVMKYTDFSFIADPNVFKAIDIPVSATGIIEGNVAKITADGMMMGQAGVKIHIMKTDSSYHETQPVFGDGSFYKMGLMPGDYIAWVDSLQCSIIRCDRPDSIKSFTIKSTKTGDFVGDINFILKQRSEGAQVAKTTEEKRKIKDYLRLLKDSVVAVEKSNQPIKQGDTDTSHSKPVAPPKAAKSAWDGNETKYIFFDGLKDTKLTLKVIRQLDDIALYMQENPSSELGIIGHTDNFGSLEETQKISEQRAKVVTDYLIKKGILKGRLFPQGKGSRNPKADNLTPDGRKQNRRVEIKVIKN